MPALDKAIEDIYTSVNNNNENIDACIDALKAAAKEAGAKEVTFDPNRLPVPNREGRLFMKSYFKKRGISITFAKA